MPHRQLGCIQGEHYISAYVMYPRRQKNPQSADIIRKSSKEEIWVLPPDPLEMNMLEERCG